MNKLIISLLLGAAILPLQAQDKETLTPGLPWALFNATDFSRRDRDNGIAAQINLDTGTRIYDYSQFWSGYLKAPASGEITIIAEADNGLRLALKGELIINGWEKALRGKGKSPSRRANTCRSSLSICRMAARHSAGCTGNGKARRTN